MKEDLVKREEKSRIRIGSSRNCHMDECVPQCNSGPGQGHGTPNPPLVSCVVLNKLLYFSVQPHGLRS